MAVTSPFAKLFLAIQDYIKQEVPEVVWIDHDLGQLDDYSGGRPPVAFPCTLIDFQNFVCENMGENTQRVEGDVVIKLAFAEHGQSNSAQPTEWREVALNYYDIELKLHVKLHGWAPAEEFGYLTRTGVVKENRPLGVRVRTMTYRIAFEDYSTQPQLDTIPTPPLEVEGEFNL